MKHIILNRTPYFITYHCKNTKNILYAKDYIIYCNIFKFFCKVYFKYVSVFSTPEDKGYCNGYQDS